jgi:putative membrane protein
MKRQSLAIAYCSLLIATPAVYAADKTEIGGSLEKKDAEFVTHAAQGGMLEVQVGQLAQKKAGSPAAKQIGQMMATDHTKANNELKALVQKKGGQVPAALDAKHQSMLDKISDKGGAEFDKAYFDLLEKAHKKDIAMFEDASQNAKDPDLKAFAAKTLPILRGHLDHVTNHEASARKTSDKPQ